MRVTITTAGSRGDLQPYVALGEGLQRAGHETTVAAGAGFEDFVRSRGLGFAPISADPRALVDGLVEEGGDPVRFMRRLVRLLEPVLEANAAEYRQACRGAEAVIATPVGFLGAKVAEKMGIPCVAALVQPLFARTRYFPNSFLPPPPTGICGGYVEGVYNRATYLLAEQIFWQPLRKPVNRVIEESLSLEKIPFWGPFVGAGSRREPVLHGWSDSVVPHPADWPPHFQTTGYWFLDRPEGWSPPSGLLDFLSEGPPPVSIGFGSMNGDTAEERTEMTLKALRRLGKRAVVLTGWGGMSDCNLPDTIYRVEDVPHDWLFPRVAAAVHHGGAGTTAAALRAGAPSVVTPFFADQFFWGTRVGALGAGPEPIKVEKLSPESLAGAIEQAAADPGMRRAAGELSRSIEEEDGVGRAVATFERMIEQCC